MRTALVLLLTAFALLSGRAQGSLSLEATTDRKYYHANTRNSVYTEVRIQTPAPVSETPAPAVHNLAFVLDRSGSMAGPPIQALRTALLSALNSLADRDIVSVVLFGSEVETLLEAQRRDQVTNPAALVARMEPAGGAALYDALNQAAAQLRRYAGPKTINHLILVTDGLPTKGPREFDDFTRLVELLAREGTTVSTIGLGQEFNEDLLAALARLGNGRFRYADQPEKLVDALQAEIAPSRTLVARDAVLTIEFASGCEKVASNGWEPSTIENGTITYRFPHLFAGRETTVLPSVELVMHNLGRYFATARLRWKDPADGSAHEALQKLSVEVDSDSRAVRDSVNPGVIRTAVSTLISEGMQHAIEQLDKGDFRRALRALRTARDDARSLNEDLADPQVAAKIQQLETYLTEVQTRGLNQLDRKILRSGLFNQFATPTAEEKPDR